MAPQSLTDLNNDVLLVLFDWIQTMDQVNSSPESTEFEHSKGLAALSSTCKHLRSLAISSVLRCMIISERTEFSNTGLREVMHATEQSDVLRAHVRSFWPFPM